MDKPQTAEQGPGDAERPQEPGAAAPGRGGRTVSDAHAGITRNAPGT
jgi:hypothetical protein